MSYQNLEEAKKTIKRIVDCSVFCSTNMQKLLDLAKNLNRTFKLSYHIDSCKKEVTVYSNNKRLMKIEFYEQEDFEKVIKLLLEIQEV